MHIILQHRVSNKSTFDILTIFHVDAIFWFLKHHSTKSQSTHKNYLILLLFITLFCLTTILGYTFKTKQVFSLTKSSKYCNTNQVHFPQTFPYRPDISKLKYILKDVLLTCLQISMTLKLRFYCNRVLGTSDYLKSSCMRLCDPSMHNFPLKWIQKIDSV